MTQRYALFATILGLPLVLSAQTALTSAEYDALKLANALPAGPIVITDAAPADDAAPAPWVLARGGGGPCGCWVEPDGTYTVALPEEDDAPSIAVDLPFTFSLFGDEYSTIYINNNGNISFVEPYMTFTAEGFPSANYHMVGPFWADVDTRDTSGVPDDYLHGQVVYKVTDHALYVNWVEVGYYPLQGDLRNSFQLIMTDGTDPVIPGGNNVSFCYQDMQWTTGSASQGVGGFGGVSATVGVNKGDGVNHSQIGRFNAPGTDHLGAYVDGSGVDWLDETHFYMNTMNWNVPPIFGSTFDCDTVIVQMPLEEAYARDEALYLLHVLPGAPDQMVSCTSDAPTLPSFVNINEGLAPGLELLFPINADGADIGIHYITFTATNDAPEPLSSTYVLQVEKTGLTTGIASANAAEGITLAPNPSSGPSYLSWPASVKVQRVELIGPDGRVVSSINVNGSESRVDLATQELGAGIYIVRAYMSGSVWTGTLVRPTDR